MTAASHRRGWHRLDNRTWYGRTINSREGSLSELLDKVPDFKKVPCAIADEGVNPNLDMIVRDRLKPHPGVLLPSTDQVQMPVATVSKKYQLVQHHHVINALARVLEENNINLEGLQSELCLTEFGERMWFSLTLPTYSFDLPSNMFFEPVDKYPLSLTINALNSVDKTTALEINLFWYRLVCGNGMVYGDNIKFKEIHRTDTLNPDAIEEFVKYQLDQKQLKSQHQLLMKWQEAQVVPLHPSEAKPSSGQIEQWLEKSVSKKWGVHAAARTYHIAKTGCDGKFVINTEKDIKKKVKFNNLTLNPKTATRVPGAFAPVRNAYDISQVLGWLASQQTTVQQQLKWMMDIPGLIRSLLRTKAITLTIDQ